MKKIIPFIAIISLLFISTSYGQVNYQNGKKNRTSLTNAHTKRLQKNRQHILAMLQKQEEERQAKIKAEERTTSVLAERLIALSDYDYYGPDSLMYGLGKVDTTRLKYSNGRGSEFNYNSMGYELPTNAYEDGYLISYLMTGLRITSSEPNYAPGVLCDSMRSWSSTIPTFSSPLYTYGYSDSTYVIYDANNNIVYYNDQTTPDLTGSLDDIYYNTYDILNNNITSLHIQYVAPTYDTEDITIQIFSGGKLVEDSLASYGGGGLFYPSDKWIYSYDGSGNLIHASDYDISTGVWVEDTRYDMTYNADNSLVSDSESGNPSGVWIPDNVDSFGYTTGVNYYTYWRFEVYDAVIANLVDQSIITSKHVGSLGFPDTVFSYQYINPSGGSSLDLNTESKAVYTYDTYKNPKIVYTYHFNITDSTTGAGYYNTTPDGYLYYYYETYMSSAAVQNVAATTEIIKIYPNPTTNEINISRPDAVKGSYTFITLTNTLGQTIRTESLPWMNETETFSMAGLAPGIYMLLVQDKNGSVLTTQKIIKH